MAFWKNIDIKGNQLLNAVLQHIGGNHPNLKEGIVWWDSVGKRVRIYDGTQVQAFALSSELASQAPGDAATLGGNDAAFYLNRTNHTGTQSTSTISNFNTSVVAFRLDQFASPTTNVSLGNQRLINVADSLNPQDAVTRSQLLSQVSGLASETFVDARIASLVDTAPGTLDTLNELAAAIGDDPNFAATISQQIALRTRKYVETFGDGAATQFTITHNLGTRDLVPSISRAAAPFSKETCLVQFPTINTAQINANPAPTLNELRITLVG